MIAPDAALFPEGLKANLDAFVAMGELTAPPPLAGFIDASFLAEVATSMTGVIGDVAGRIRGWTISCGEMPAFVAVPEGAAHGAAPAVIVIHERYGFVRHISRPRRALCRATDSLRSRPISISGIPDQEALHRGDAGCDVSDPEAVVALGVGDRCARARDRKPTPSRHRRDGHLPDRAPSAGARGLAPARRRPGVVRRGAAARVGGRTPNIRGALDDIIAAIDCPVLGMFGETDHLISLDDVRAPARLPGTSPQGL